MQPHARWAAAPRPRQAAPVLLRRAARGRPLRGPGPDLGTLFPPGLPSRRRYRSGWRGVGSGGDCPRRSGRVGGRTRAVGAQPCLPGRAVRADSDRDTVARRERVSASDSFPALCSESLPEKTSQRRGLLWTQSAVSESRTRSGPPGPDRTAHCRIVRNSESGGDSKFRRSEDPTRAR